MEASKIMSADILDIIFEGRNKAYGAYALRKTYNERIAIAITVMILFCLFMILGFNRGSGNKSQTPIFVDSVVLVNVENTEIKPKVLLPKSSPKTSDPKIITKIFSTPVIEKNVVQLMAKKDELDKAQIGLFEQSGVEDTLAITSPVEKKGPEMTKPENKKEDYEGVFKKVEKEATFPGGIEAWKKYLERNLNAQVASENGAPPGNYSVSVQFVVDKEGGISNVQAIDVPKACPYCRPEAVKVIKKGPKWEHAEQNGKAVIYQAVQLITFQVAEE